MDNLAIHFLNDDEQLATQEAVNKLVFNNTGANDEAQLDFSTLYSTLSVEL